MIPTINLEVITVRGSVKETDWEVTELEGEILMPQYYSTGSLTDDEFFKFWGYERKKKVKRLKKNRHHNLSLKIHK